MEQKNMQFEVAWVPRDQNAEADAITNGDWHWLEEKNRVASDIKKLPFLVLHELLAQGEMHYANLDTVNLVGERERPDSNTLLKVRDSWDL